MKPPGARAHRPLLDAELLRRLRLEQGLTLHGLAKSIGRTGKCLRAIEAGLNHETITLGDLANLADALGVGPDQLLAAAGASERQHTGSTYESHVLRRHEAKLLLRIMQGELTRAAGGSKAEEMTLGRMELAGIVHYPLGDRSAGRAPALCEQTLYCLCQERSPTEPDWVR